MGEEQVFATRVMERREYFTIPNIETVAAVPASQIFSTPRREKKKSHNMNKRRFSDEQIRSLESIFYSSVSKLDPRKKVQLATELGLQPRQVATWFQNRRARWKSKQTENDFRRLRANYENLASQFKSLLEEKNSLLSQLQKLSGIVQEGAYEGYYSYGIGKTTCETHGKAKGLQDELEQRGVTHLNSNYMTDKKWLENEEGDNGLPVTHILDNRSNGASHAEEQACQLLNPNGSSEQWCGFDSDCGVIFENQSCSSLQRPTSWG